MRLKIIALIAAVVVAYIIGTRAPNRRGRRFEPARLQLERLIRDPKARRARARLGKKAGKSVTKAARKAKTTIRAKR